MRPLPPFNMRPSKRTGERKHKPVITGPMPSSPPAIRANRLMVKAPTTVGKPPMKVLENR